MVFDLQSERGATWGKAGQGEFAPRGACPTSHIGKFAPRCPA